MTGNGLKWPEIDIFGKNDLKIWKNGWLQSNAWELLCLLYLRACDTSMVFATAEELRSIMSAVLITSCWRYQSTNWTELNLRVFWRLLKHMILKSSILKRMISQEWTWRLLRRNGWYEDEATIWSIWETNQEVYRITMNLSWRRFLVQTETNWCEVDEIVLKTLLLNVITFWFW